MKNLIVLVGPTGVGKTETSIRIASYFNAPVVSSDSRQVYAEMSIGTAVPSPEELSAAKHYFIQTVSAKEHYNAGRYEEEALPLINRLFADHDNILLVGGSGLYVDAVCEGFDDVPEASHELRRELAEKWESSEEYREMLLNKLQELDPDFFAVVDKKNPKRVIRALEVCMTSGKRYSEMRKGEPKKRGFNIIKVGFTRDREELYDRINRRVDKMMEEGLLEEVRKLEPLKGYNALQTVGYRELFDYLDGKYTLNEAVELIKRNSRRYAKRQMTWFGKDENITWFHPDETEKAINYIGEKIGSQQNADTQG